MDVERHLRFIPTARDLQLAEAERQARKAGWFGRVTAYRWIGPMYIVFAFAYGVEWLWGTRMLPTSHVQPWAPWMALLYGALGIVWTVIQIRSPRSNLPELRASTEIDLRFDDSGITVGGTKPYVIPWRRIVSVRETNEAFTISGLNDDWLVIPRHALPDGGTALWAFFDDRLVGKYNLIRPPRPLRLIVNSSGR